MPSASPREPHGTHIYTQDEPQMPHTCYSHTHMSTHMHSFTLQAIETYLMTALGAPPPCFTNPTGRTRTRSHPRTSNRSPAQTQTPGVCHLNSCTSRKPATCHNDGLEMFGHNAATTRRTKIYVYAKKMHTWNYMHSLRTGSPMVTAVMIFILLYHAVMVICQRTLLAF